MKAGKNMRNLYYDVFKKFFYNKLIENRTSNNYTQAQMSALLVMDERSYVELDHGKSCCSALTLALFLVYCCDDPINFINELREVFDNEFKKVA